MKEFNYKITDPAGIHARPAGLLVKKTQPYASEISLVKDGKTGNGKSMLSVMGLGAKNGENITVQADGPDEDTAIVVEDNLSFYVVGKGVATIIDGRNIEYTNITEQHPDESLALTNVTLHIPLLLN